MSVQLCILYSDGDCYCQRRFYRWHGNSVYRERVGQIRANKKEQRQKANLTPLQENPQMADIIKFNKSVEDDDYSLPFSPGLFSDDEE